MTSEYIRSKGTVFKVAISTVYTAIPQIETFTPAGPETGDIPLTNLDSTAGEHESDQIPEPGDIPFRLFWMPNNTVHQYLATAAAAGTNEAFKTYYTDASSNIDAVAGYVNKFRPSEVKQGTVLMIDGNIKGSGPIARTHS